MEKGVSITQASLRVCCLISALVAAFLVRLDAQTKEIIYTVEKTATFRDMKIFGVFVIVEAMLASYNFLQLFRSAVSARLKDDKMNATMIWLGWINFFTDQMMAYLSLATTAAATEASFLAVTGANTFQWSKLCIKFTRFCHQIGGGLLCAITASLLMAAIASISAFYLFRLYSPKRFFSLKPHLR